LFCEHLGIEFRIDVTSERVATATFFVGLSCADQRTIFTYCDERGDRRWVDVLYRLLEAAGAPERELGTSEVACALSSSQVVSGGVGGPNSGRS
jgi:hypothetical protein